MPCSWSSAGTWDPFHIHITSHHITSILISIPTSTCEKGEIIREEQCRKEKGREKKKKKRKKARFLATIHCRMRWAGEAAGRSGVGPPARAAWTSAGVDARGDCASSIANPARRVLANLRPRRRNPRGRGARGGGRNDHRPRGSPGRGARGRCGAGSAPTA